MTEEERKRRKKDEKKENMKNKKKNWGKKLFQVLFFIKKNFVIRLFNDQYVYNIFKKKSQERKKKFLSLDLRLIKDFFTK